jgi:hypothetical protein
MPPVKAGSLDPEFGPADLAGDGLHSERWQVANGERAER